MSKIAVVYWSGTGNTEAMADAVLKGAKDKGAEVDIFTAAEFSADKMGDYDAVAFGCPSMGVEELEDSEFQPMFESCEAALSGQKDCSFRFLRLGRRRMDEKLGRKMHFRRAPLWPAIA